MRTIETQTVTLKRTFEMRMPHALALTLDSQTGHRGIVRYWRVSPTYRSWVEMHRRCRKPKDLDIIYYANIKVCSRWGSFGLFLFDMGLKPTNHSLDRINNDGNYEPMNCRWATAKQQANNRRNIWNPSHKVLTRDEKCQRNLCTVKKYQQKIKGAL